MSVIHLNHALVVTWTARDVIGLAKGMGKKLTDKEAIEILKDIAENYDSETGIHDYLVTEFIRDYTTKK